MPTVLVDGCEVRLQDFKMSLSSQLIAMVVSTLHQLHNNITQSKKRRRVSNVRSQVTALLRGVEASLGPVSVDALVNSSSSSSASIQSLPQTSSWLLGGVGVDLKSIFALRPGLSLPSQNDFAALGHVVDQLLFKAWETTRLSSEARLRAGNLKPYERGDEVSKIFIRRSDSGSTKSSAKHRLVWIASMGYLRSRLEMAHRQQMQSFDVESCGVWALIVGEGRDLLTVLPRIRDLPTSDNDELGRVVLLQGPDFHRYVQIYESLYAAERRNRVARAGDGASAPCGMELFRVWLGLHPSQTDCDSVSLLLGPRIVRVSLLDCAELVLGVEFSEFQRSCILDIHSPITHWSFVAGAGKTQMLLALV